MSLLVIVILFVAFLVFIAFLAIVRSLIGLALAFLVALLAGLFAENLVGEQQRDPLLTLLLGFIGAITGAVIARVTDLPRLITVGGLPLIWTIIGTIIVAFAWHLLRPLRSPW